MDGLIKQHGLIWVGQNSALKTKIIAAMHSSPIGGHSGAKAAFHRVKRLFCWKGIRSDVNDFVRQCSICQQAKHELLHSPGLLQPLPIPAGAWTDLTMDFIEGLPKSDSYDTILVVVDRLTKVAHFLPLKHPLTAQQVARSFLDHIVKLHGVPNTIVTDHDRIFLSAFWKELFHLLGTKLISSTAYHPQTDGQTERVN